MTSLVRAALQGEIIPPGKGLTLIVVPRILSLDALPPIEVEAGLSLLELTDRAVDMSGAADFRFGYDATINGLPIDQSLWSRVRPKPGTTVVLRAVAEFGGENVLNKLLSAAVTVAGAVLTGINPLLGAAVTIGGQMLVNALFPIAPPVMASVDNGSLSSPTYSLTGAGNVADLWGVVPAHLGRNRYTPKLGAKTYSEFVGGDQFLRMLLVWGEGPLEISSLKIGETPIEAFQDVQIETRFGYADDAPVTLYPKEVEEEALAIDLSVAGGPQVRRTAVAIDEISIDADAPTGIVLVDEKNVAQSYDVIVRYEYSLVGSGVWTLLGTLTFSGRSRDPIRQGLRAVVANGQYDVRATKVSADYAGSSNVVEQVRWIALRGFRNGPMIRFGKPLAITALRIRANSQLAGQIDDLNGVVASRVLAFDGHEWTADVVSNRPADLFRHVCQGGGLATPLVDAEVDIESLEGWWQFCKDHDYTFNMVRDFEASGDDALIALAAAGRAAVTRRDGKRGVIWDDPAAPVVQFFSPRNSWGFSWERQYRKSPPHALRIRFKNEEAGSAQDEMIVYDDGYNADGSDGLVKASLFESIEVPGRTTSDLVYKDGRYHLAQMRLRPDIYTLNADLASLSAARGRRVRVMSDVALWGLGSGRVLSTEASGDDDQIEVDEPILMEAGKSYSIRFWFADSTTVTRDIITDDGEHFTTTLAGHGELPEPGDHWAYGEEGKDSVVLRVKHVWPGQNMSARLELVDDAPDILQAESGIIPEFDSQVSLPVDRYAAAPTDLSVTEAFEGVDGASQTGVVLYWSAFPGSTPTGFDVEYRDDDGDKVWKRHETVLGTSRVSMIPGLLQGHWSFQVRSVFSDGKVSRWALLELIDVTVGAGLQLPDVENFVASYDDDQVGLKWDKVRFPKLEVFYEIRKGADWETGLTIARQIADPPVALSGAGDYWIKPLAQPFPGTTIYSPNAKKITIAGALLNRNVLARRDERLDGWTGTITGPAVIDGEFIRTTASGEWAYYELAGDRIFDIGWVRQIRIESDVQAVGLSAADDFLSNPDVLGTADIFNSELTQLIEMKVEIAEALDIDEDIYAGQDVYASPDVYEGSVFFEDWKKFATGQYRNRFSKLRIALKSNDPSVHAALLDWIVAADVPDRLDHITSYSLDAAGETFIFRPDNSDLQRPFRGGHNGTALPGVFVAVLDGVAGDVVEVSGKTLEQVTIQVRNAGIGVARTVDILIQGW